MSKQTANELVDYMLEHKGEGPLSLHWFGGEPLVGIERIRQICTALRERGVEFKSRMTSNGYLLTGDIVKEAVESWNLKRVQITLDGTEDIYNRTKAYHGIDCDNESPYRRVLANIQVLIDHKVNVNIRLNLDKHNYGDMVLLVDELEELFSGNTYVSVYVHVLFEDQGFDSIVRSCEDNDMLHKRQVELTKRIAEASLSRPPRSLSFLRIHGCMADNPSTVVVYSDGRLFKCQHTAEGDDYGNLERGITCQQNVNKFKPRATYSECDDCPLYPSCYKLKECPDTIKVGCNSILRQRTLRQNLEAMLNVYSAQQ